MRFRLLLPAFLLALTLSAPALARGTLDSILPGIRAEHPGRLSDAEPWVDSNGRTHYRIKWMTPEGRILYFDADPETGRYRSTGAGGGEWRGGRRGGDSRDDRDDRDDRDGRRHNNWRDDGGSSPFGGDYGGSGSRGGDWRDRNSGGGRNGGSHDNGGRNGGSHDNGGRWNDRGGNHHHRGDD